jgi:hypothetical protein
MMFTAGIEEAEGKNALLGGFVTVIATGAEEAGAAEAAVAEAAEELPGG